MSVNNYKFDDRTKEEFISDMEKGLKAEVRSINTFRNILNISDVEHPEVIYVGSDEEGQISYDKDNEVANVDLFPDYLLKYKENRRIRAHFIEVKVCNPHSQECFFKVKQLEQYKELEKVVILFIMGFDTASPRFVLVKPEEILNLGVRPTKVYGKSTIKVPVSFFNWEDFSTDKEGIGNILTKKYVKNRRENRKPNSSFTLSESAKFKNI
jgi:hypothetical protein